jgi:hypothetical protein
MRDRIAAEEGGPALWKALEAELDEGHALVFLDGVDEEPDELRRLGLVKQVERFLESTRSRCLVTSRPAGYFRIQSDAGHFTLPNFDETQIEAFARQWHVAFEQGRNPRDPDLDRAQRRAGELLSDIRSNPRVNELAANPLMLVIMMLIREHGMRLPDRRVELYDRAVRLLLGIWRNLRSELEASVGETEELAVEDLLKALGQVGWSAHHDPSGLIPGPRLMDELADAIRLVDPDGDDPYVLARSYMNAAAEISGLLEERAAGIFSFWHQTFEEFLAAAYLARDLNTTKDQLIRVADDPRWQEVVLLTIGHAGVLHHQEITAGSLVQALLTERPGPTERLLHWRVRLSAACIVEDVRVPKESRDIVIVRLLEAVCLHPTDELIESLEQVTAAVVRQGIRVSRSVLPALNLAMRMNHWRINRDACRLATACVIDLAGDNVPQCDQLLSHRRPEVRFQALMLWSKLHPDARDVGERLSSCCEGAPDWISPREIQGIDTLAGAVAALGGVSTGRQPAATAAARVLALLPPGDDVVCALGRGLQAKDRATVTVVADRLADLSSSHPMATELLEAAMVDADLAALPVIARRLQKLERAGPAVVRALLRALESDDVNVVMDAVDLLGEYGQHDQEVAASVARVVSGPEFPFVLSTLGFVGYYRESEAFVAALEQALHADDFLVASSAATHLVRLIDGSNRAESAVRRALESDNLRTSALVAVALANAGAEWDVMPSLERGLESDDTSLLMAVIDAMLRLDRDSAESSIDPLRRLLAASTMSTVVDAANHLIDLGQTDREVLESLERCLESTNLQVALSAAGRLIELHDGNVGEAVTGALERVVVGDDQWLAGQAARRLEALGRSADLVAALDLTLARHDPRSSFSPLVELAISSQQDDGAGLGHLKRWLTAGNADVAVAAARRLIELNCHDGAVIEALVDLTSSTDQATSRLAAREFARLAAVCEPAEVALEKVLIFGDINVANAATGAFVEFAQKSWLTIARLAAPLIGGATSILASDRPPDMRLLSAASYGELATLLRVKPDDSEEIYRRKRLLLLVLPQLIEGDKSWSSEGTTASEA